MARPPTMRYATLDDCHEATGLVVVVDVIRAFTTAAHVLDRGATEIWPVAGIDEAFALRAQHPDALLIGEEGGVRVEGFDAGNSPSRLDDAAFDGRLVVQRTSAGTQGVVRSVNADAMLAASFVCAAATARAIAGTAADAVTFVITGRRADRDGDEDRACADYLAALLRGDAPDPRPFLDRVPASTAGRLFLSDDEPELPASDLAFVTELDRFDFALPVTRRGGRPVLRRTRRP